MENINQNCTAQSKLKLGRAKHRPNLISTKKKLIIILQTEHQNKNILNILTRPVTGRSLRICRHFTKKGFEILVHRELINTGNWIENSYIVCHLVLPVS